MKQVGNTSSDSIRQCHQQRKKDFGHLQEPVKLDFTDSLFAIEVAIRALRTILTAHLEYLAHVNLLPCLLDVLLI